MKSYQVQISQFSKEGQHLFKSRLYEVLIKSKKFDESKSLQMFGLINVKNDVNFKNLNSYFDSKSSQNQLTGDDEDLFIELTNDLENNIDSLDQQAAKALYKRQFLILMIDFKLYLF